MTDNPQTGKESQDGTRLILLIPRWKCVREGQARENHERRCRANVGNGGGRFWTWRRGQRVHGIRILRVRTIDSIQQLMYQDGVPWADTHIMASIPPNVGHWLSYRNEGVFVYILQSRQVYCKLYQTLRVLHRLSYSDLVLSF